MMSLSDGFAGSEMEPRPTRARPVALKVGAWSGRMRKKVLVSGERIVRRESLSGMKRNGLFVGKGALTNRLVLERRNPLLLVGNSQTLLGEPRRQTF